MFIKYFAIFFALITTTATYANEEEPRSGLSTSIVLVNDIQTSVAFYKDIMGFDPSDVLDVDSAASASSMGLERYNGFLVSYVKPVGTFKSGVDAFSLVQPKWKAGENVMPAQSCKNRQTKVGGVILSFQVYGLDEIVRRAGTKNICTITPASLSSSGRSRTAAILDPNGIVIEMYEYVEQ